MIPFDSKKGGAGAAVLMHSTESGSMAKLPDTDEDSSQDPRHEVSAELVDAIHAKDAHRVTDAMHAFVKMTQNRDLEDSEAPESEDA